MEQHQKTQIQENQNSGSFKYFVLTQYIILNIICGSIPSAVMPISNLLADAYNLELYQIDLTCSLTSISCIVFAIPSNLMLIYMGIRKSISIACILIIIGSIIRIGMNWWIWSLHIGQILIGLGLPQVLNAQLAFTKTWFTPNVRGLYAGIIGLSNPIGVVFGYVLPQILPVTRQKNPTNEDVRSDLYLYMIGLAISYLLIGILNIIFTKAGPVNPNLTEDSQGSNQQADGALNIQMVQNESFLTNKELLNSKDNKKFKQSKNEDETNFCVHIKTMVVDVWYQLALIIYSIGWGSIASVSNVINQIITIWDYSTTEGSMICGLAVFIGLVSMIQYSVFLLPYKNQYLLLMLMFFGAGISFILGVFLIELKTFFVLLAFGIVFGQFALNMIPIMMDMIMKKTTQSMTLTMNCMLNVGGQGVTALTVFYMGIILDSKREINGKIALAIFSSYYFICIVLTIILQRIDRNRKSKKMRDLPKKSTVEGSTLDIHLKSDSNYDRLV